MIGVFVLLVGGVNAPDQKITVPIAAFSVFALALVATHGFLPMLIATWRLPDPPPDDEF
jgi:hypothetical protein